MLLPMLNDLAEAMKALDGKKYPPKKKKGAWSCMLLQLKARMFEIT